MMHRLPDFPLKGEAWVLRRSLVLHRERATDRVRLYEWNGAQWRERASGSIDLERLLELSNGSG